MTNGDRTWLEEVKGALLRDAKLSASSPTSTEWQFGWAWENASTSRAPFGLGRERCGAGFGYAPCAASRALRRQRGEGILREGNILQC